MSFARKLLAGLGAEFRAIFGIVPLLHRQFWIVWSVFLPLTLVGLLPGRWAVAAQLLVLGGIGLGVLLLAGNMAKAIRRRRWVEYPDGTEVAPCLPQLVTLLAGPPYMIAMVVLFRRAAAEFPGILPTAGWGDALLLGLDNFIRTQIFFDAAECFHLRLDGRIEGAGTNLVFVSRLLMDMVFIKLAVQLFNAAYYRALGMGRGEDKLYSLKQEVEAGDAARVKYLAQSVGDSLRDAVDTLRSYWEEGGDKAEMAWRCLVTMKDYALPYLKDQERAATGEERHRLAKLIDRLGQAKPEEGQVPGTVDRRPLVVLVAAVGVGLLLSLFLPGVVGLTLSAFVTGVLSWMLAGSRGWIDRLVRWRVLSPSTPDRLPRRQLRWALCVLVPLLLSWSRLLQLVALPIPDIFSGASGEVNYPSTLVFGLENLVHTQVFADTFEVYGVRIADIRQEGFVGGVLTFLLRLVLNIGMIELIVAFGMVWFNRVWHKFAVSPNSELALRKEAHECGPQAAAMVGYYLREVRGFLVEAMKMQNRDIFTALLMSGIWIWSRDEDDFRKMLSEELLSVLGSEDASRPENCDLGNRALTRHQDANRLVGEGRIEDAIAEFEGIRVMLQQVDDGDDKLVGKLTWLAKTEMGLGKAFERQGRLNEATAQYRKALEIEERIKREGGIEEPSGLGIAGGTLGDALYKQGLFQDARAAFEASADVWEWFVREGRATQDYRHSLAVTRHKLGNTLLALGREEEAIAHYRVAREVMQRLVNEVHDDLFKELNRKAWLPALAAMRLSLGTVLSRQGKLDDAVLEYQAALEIREQLVREGRNDLRSAVAATRLGLGNALLDQGRQEEARSQYQVACETFDLLLAEGRDDLRNDLAGTRMNLAVALENQGRLGDAVAEYKVAWEILEKLVREGQLQVVSDFAVCWCNMLRAVRRINAEEADMVVRAGCSLLRELLPERESLPASALKYIGDFLTFAQESQLCAEAAAALAGQFARPPTAQ